MSNPGEPPAQTPPELPADQPSGEQRLNLGKDRPPQPTQAHPQPDELPYAAPGDQPQYGAPPTYAPEPGYPPPPTGPARPSAASQLGLILAVLGLGVTAAGLFALPLASYPRLLGGTYFGQVRDFVRLASDRALDRYYSGLAQIWWNWGLLLVGAVLVVLVALAAITPTRRLVGVLIAVVAVAAGVLQAVALANSPDLRQVSVTLRAGSSMYKYAGSGLWIAFIGFGVLALGGVLLAASSPRR